MLTRNTPQTLQKTPMHILVLSPLPFHQVFTISKLISFASWETVTYRQMGLLCCLCRVWLFQVIEPGLLWWKLAATTTLLQTIIPSSNVLSWAPTGPEKTLLHAIGTHPPSDSTPSPAHTSDSLIKHFTSPITGRLQDVHNILRTFKVMHNPQGARVRSVVVFGLCCAHHWATQIQLERTSHKIKNAHHVNDFSLHVFATHLLAHNTLPALQ